MSSPLFLRGLLLSLFLSVVVCLFGQNRNSEPAGIMFYNVENLFNPEHNEEKTILNLLLMGIVAGPDSDR